MYTVFTKNGYTLSVLFLRKLNKESSVHLQFYPQSEGNLISMISGKPLQ